MKNLVNLIDFYDFDSSHKSNYPFPYYRKPKDGIHLIFPLPGYGKENVSCSLASNCLKIDLEDISDQFISKKGSYLISIPNDLDVETLTAKMENGILEIVANSFKEKEIKLRIC
jgi:HSP20 family molecular chaperone IbpA